MVNLFERMIDELDEKAKKDGIKVYGELIRKLFHLSDDVRYYLFYDAGFKITKEFNLHRSTPTEQYLENLCDIIYEIGQEWYHAGYVEVYDDFDIHNNCITVSIVTLTACADPEVNYYDDGVDSIMDFIEELKERLQVSNITFTEDIDVDEYSGKLSQSGFITIKVGK